MHLMKELDLIDMFILISYQEVKMNLSTRWSYVGHFVILIDLFSGTCVRS